MVDHQIQSGDFFSVYEETCFLPHNVALLPLVTIRTFQIFTVYYSGASHYIYQLFVIVSHYTNYLLSFVKLAFVI